jgi:hypothetical protein
MKDGNVGDLVATGGEEGRDSQLGWRPGDGAGRAAGLRGDQVVLRGGRVGRRRPGGGVRRNGMPAVAWGGAGTRGRREEERDYGREAAGACTILLIKTNVITEYKTQQKQRK